MMPVIRRNSEYKQMAFETAVRNPERYLGILRAIVQFKDILLNEENLLNIVSSLYLVGEVTSREIVINEFSTIKNIKSDVIRVNNTRNADGGFPKGYASRFWTYMRTLSELGFVYAQFNEPLKFSEMAQKLISGEIDEQEAFSVQAMKYNRRSPYRNISNDYNFFRLALETLLFLKKKGSKLSYEQFIILMFNQSGDIKETLEILRNNSFASDEQAYDFVSKKYRNTNKIKTVTGDYPDVVRRLLTISGFITIRYQGKKFIEINENKLDYIKELLDIKFEFTEEEKINAKRYFNKLGSLSKEHLVLISKHRKKDVISGPEYTSKINDIIDLYGIDEDKIIESINKINSKHPDIISEFKEIPAPLKLEFYISILVALKYKDKFYIRPNYKADHIGKPYSHAPGNHGDIYVYSKDIYWLIEVTLIRNKTQQLNSETTSVVRHLSSDKEFVDYPVKYLSLVAPVIHEDTKSFLDVTLIKIQEKDKKINIKPYSIDNFIDVTRKKENFIDMERYTKKIFESFKSNISKN